MHRCSHLDLGHQCDRRVSLLASLSAIPTFDPLCPYFPILHRCFFWLYSDLFPCIWTKDLLACSGCNLLMVARSDSQFSDPESIVDCTFAPTLIDLKLNPARQILGYTFWDNDNVPSGSGTESQRSYFGWRNAGSPSHLSGLWDVSTCFNFFQPIFQLSSVGNMWNNLEPVQSNRSGWESGSGNVGFDEIPVTNSGEGTGFQNISDGASAFGFAVTWSNHVNPCQSMSYARPNIPFWLFLLQQTRIALKNSKNH